MVKQHPYVRAYLAGIAVPTVFLLAAMTAYTIIRYVYAVPIPLERIIVFPMAVVPNAWGLWNVLYVAFAERRHVPLGLFGGALPLLLLPCAYIVTRLVDVSMTGFVLHGIAFAIPVAFVLYYLVWKHLVGFLNAELGIS
jgi:hypothetical protein